MKDSSYMYCAKCGKQNVDGVEFCVYCGIDLSQMIPVPDTLSDIPKIDGPQQPTVDDESKISDSPVIVEPQNKNVSIGDSPTVPGSYTPDYDISLGDMKTIVGDSDSFEAVGDRFEIMEELGRGGVGAVYKAQDHKLGRTVALKCLHAHTAESKKAIDRFWREAKVVASLNHFNIIQVFDILEDGRKLWIVMEFVESGSLQEKLGKQGALEAEQVRQIGIQLASALSDAHEKGIIHRDIKPANILLNDKGIPKLGDFGLARENDALAGITLTGSQIGTMYYAAPEQMTSGSNVDARSDIYSLGATLYALATGEAPRSIRLGRVDKGLKDTLAKCLEEHPDDRYANADELFDALQAGAKSTATNLDVSCQSCGNINPVDAKFCEKCGSDLSFLFIRCPKCQRENRKYVQYCGSCGLDSKSYHDFWNEYITRKKSLTPHEALKLLKSARKQFPWDKELEKECNHFKELQGKIDSFVEDAKKALENRDYEKALKEYENISLEAKNNTEFYKLKKQLEKIKNEHLADWDKFNKTRFQKSSHAVKALEQLQSKYPWDEQVKQRINKIKKAKEKRDALVEEIKRASKDRNYPLMIEKYNEIDPLIQDSEKIQPLKKHIEKLKAEHRKDWANFNDLYYEHNAAIKLLKQLQQKYPWDKRVKPALEQQLDMQDAILKANRVITTVKWIALILLCVGTPFFTASGWLPAVIFLVTIILVSLMIIYISKRRAKKEAQSNLIEHHSFGVWKFIAVLLFIGTAAFVVTRLSIEGYKTNPIFPQPVQDYSTAREAYKDAVNEHLELLQQYGGDKWQEVLRHSLIGAAASDDELPEGAAAYARAKAGLPGAVAQAEAARKQTRLRTRVEEIEDLLAQANTAKSQGDWQAVNDILEDVTIDSSSLGDKAQQFSSKISDLLAQAEEHLAPTWQVVTLVNGRKVPATIKIGSQNFTAPQTLRLEKGKSYTAEFSYNSGKKSYHAEPASIIADWKGEREKQVNLTECRLPPGLRDVANAKYPSVKGLASGSREAQQRQRGAVRETGLPLEVECEKTGIQFRLIPAGEFVMGGSISPSEVASKYGGQAEWYRREHPQRTVRITKPFYMSVTPVTQEQYERITGDNPSSFEGDNLPVERVSWNDAVDFCSQMSLLTGLKVSLPTEAQWEYACRAGTTTPFYFGNSLVNLAEYAWFWANSDSKTHPVGTKKPNAFGLYDMHGNVWQWCLDWFQESYSELATVDPQGPTSGYHRVLRGGSWTNYATFCRSAFRDWYYPDFTDNSNGFRVVLSID